MTAYQNKNQIHTQLEHMLPEQVAACKEEETLPSFLKDIILHNFQAEFVCYKKEDKTIEIGVEQDSNTSYPEIKTYTYPLKDMVSLLGKTYRSEDQDLDFYAKIIARTGSEDQIDEVVLV